MPSIEDRKREDAEKEKEKDAAEIRAQYLLHAGTAQARRDFEVHPATPSYRIGLEAIEPRLAKTATHSVTHSVTHRHAWVQNINS